jgi:hypothetical protein
MSSADRNSTTHVNTIVVLLAISVSEDVSDTLYVSDTEDVLFLEAPPFVHQIS